MPHVPQLPHQAKALVVVGPYVFVIFSDLAGRPFTATSVMRFCVRSNVTVGVLIAICAPAFCGPCSGGGFRLRQTNYQ